MTAEAYAWLLVAAIIVVILVVLFMMAVDEEERIYEEGLKLRAQPQATYLSQLLEDKDEGALE